MDVSWIPGSADLVVVIVAGLAVVGGAGAAVVSRRRSVSKRERAAQAGPPASGHSIATGTADAPEAPSDRLTRLRTRLAGGLGASLLAIFSKDTLSQDDWDELEETLLLADVGAAATDDILSSLRTRLRADPDADPRTILRAVLIDTIDPSLDRSLALSPVGAGAHDPIVVVGVNGVGKTTTVGKIARVLVAEGRTVVLGAADTFRAAAADQLETWGARVGVETVRSEREGADPASVAFEAADRARSEGTDVLLIDTAGRLQNKAGLMDELGKLIRVVSKVAPPVEVLLVLDATTGQNGLQQARVFAEVAQVTGIVLTKLDGTAKGGIVVAVQRELGVPVKLIGLGEGADDLALFDAEQFVDGLLGEPGVSQASLAAGAAVAQVVEAYEHAWRTASFDAFVGLVTPALAADLGIDTPASFSEAAADHLEGSAGLTTTVTGIDVHGDAATVMTTETSLDGSDHVVEKVAHRLVLVEGAWRIDAVEIASS